MNQHEAPLTINQMYLSLQEYGITPTFMANTLNNRGLTRKTNSPYIAQTVIYVANDYQKDDNVAALISELHGTYCSKTTLQNA
jgi:hypothetical protein